LPAAPTAAAIVAVAAVWYTGQSLVAAQQQIALTESAQVQDRYVKATERALSEDSATRLLGLAELDSMVREDPAEEERVRFAIAEILRKITRKDAKCVHGMAANEPKDVLYAAWWLANHNGALKSSGALEQSRDGSRLTILCVERIGSSEEAPNGVVVSINLARPIAGQPSALTDFVSIVA